MRFTRQTPGTRQFEVVADRLVGVRQAMESMLSSRYARVLAFARRAYLDMSEFKRAFTWLVCCLVSRRGLPTSADATPAR